MKSVKPQLDTVKYLKENLDIVLITWNRQKYLSKMLDGIFAKNSPVRECSVTILDNHSTDGTADYLKKKTKENPNLKHIRNKFNVGGDPNLVKALEAVDENKKYFWVLTDDDFLDWTYWDKVQDALKSDEYDALIIGKLSRIDEEFFLTETQLKAIMVKQASWIPCCIYKTSLLTPETMQNAYHLTLFLFPILAVFVSIINNNGKVYSLDYREAVAHFGDPYYFDAENDQDYSRGTTRNDILSVRTKMVYESAFLRVLGLIKNEKICEYLMDYIGNHNGQTFTGVLRWLIPTLFYLEDYDSLFAFYKSCSEKQKAVFVKTFSIYVNEQKQVEIERAKKMKSVEHIPLKPLVYEECWRRLAKKFDL